MMIVQAVGFVVLGVGLFLLAAYVLTWLWNWLVPLFFNGPRLWFLQALGLLVLAHLLIGLGAWRGGRRSHYGYGRHQYLYEHRRLRQKPVKYRIRPLQKKTELLQTRIL
ncbi:hypothetical protein [Spirosoma knui]